MSDPTRRAFLAGVGGVAGALALPGTALAFGSSSLLDIAELDLGPGTQSRPNAWKRLLYDVLSTTSVASEPRSVRYPPHDKRLFEHPFTVLLGDGEFAMPDEGGLEQLGRYLAYGGFLFVDDTSGAENSGFDRAFRRLATALFPTRPLAPLPADHSLFRSFFLIDRPLGSIAKHAYVEGVTVGNIAPLVYCRNDVSGALERGGDGRPVRSCVPGGEGQRREAMKLGINLVMYSLTANYKKDQAHVRQLILEGRIE